MSEQCRTAIVLASASAAGESHIALLSRAEALAVEPGRLRLALHANSATSANLRTTHHATLMLADEDGVETAALTLESLGAREIAGVELALFEALVVDARRHVVPYATVTGGIMFELAAPAETLARWEATIDLLRDSAGAT